MSEALLDDGEVDALFADIAELGIIDEILIKAGPGRVDDNRELTLAEARHLLGSGAIFGVQIRYRHDHAHWWDTLIRTGDKFRLVRVRHDFKQNT